MHDGKCDYVDFFGAKCEAASDWLVYGLDDVTAECCNDHQRHFATTFVPRENQISQADGAT